MIRELTIKKGTAGSECAPLWAPLLFSFPRHRAAYCRVQTHFLALVTAGEAIRAGVQGKAFTMVALETRSRPYRMKRRPRYRLFYAAFLSESTYDPALILTLSDMQGLSVGRVMTIVRPSSFLSTAMLPLCPFVTMW